MTVKEYVDYQAQLNRNKKAGKPRASYNTNKTVSGTGMWERKKD